MAWNPTVLHLRRAEHGDLFVEIRARQDSKPSRWLWRLSALLVWLDLLFQLGVGQSLSGWLWEAARPYLDPDVWNRSRLFTLVGFVWFFGILARLEGDRIVGVTLYVTLFPLIALWQLRTSFASSKPQQFLAEEAPFPRNRSLAWGVRPRRRRRLPTLRVWLFSVIALLLTWNTTRTAVLLALLTVFLLLTVTHAHRCFEVAVRPAHSRQSNRLIALLTLLYIPVADFAFLIADITDRSGPDPHHVRLSFAKWILDSCQRVSLSLYLLLRRNDARLGTAIVILHQTGRAVALAAASILAAAVWLRVSVGPEIVDQGTAMFLSISTVFPSVPAPSAAVPPLVLAGIGLTEWLLLVLWFAPSVELFPEWRDHYTDTIRRSLRVVRVLARTAQMNAASFGRVAARKKELATRT